jgi:hypothetical protein
MKVMYSNYISKIRKWVYFIGKGLDCQFYSAFLSSLTAEVSNRNCKFGTCQKKAMATFIKVINLVQVGNLNESRERCVALRNFFTHKKRKNAFTLVICLAFARML